MVYLVDSEQSITNLGNLGEFGIKKPGLFVGRFSHHFWDHNMQQELLTTGDHHQHKRRTTVWMIVDRGVVNNPNHFDNNWVDDRGPHFLIKFGSYGMLVNIVAADCLKMEISVTRVENESVGS